MDKLTLLGLIVGVTGIMAGQVLEGGGLSIMFQGAAFLIVSSTRPRGKRMRPSGP